MAVDPPGIFTTTTTSRAPSLTHLPPSQVSGTHYPERLGVFMVVDPPGIFTILWKAIQAFVDPKTYTKIRCVYVH